MDGRRTWTTGGRGAGPWHLKVENPSAAGRVRGGGARVQGGGAGVERGLGVRRGGAGVGRGLRGSVGGAPGKEWAA